MTNKYKEIKEALEAEIHLVEYVDGLYAENISIELLKDILDFINSQQAEMDKIKKKKTKVLKNGNYLLIKQSNITPNCTKRL